MMPVPEQRDVIKAQAKRTSLHDAASTLMNEIVINFGTIDDDNVTEASAALLKLKGFAAKLEPLNEIIEASIEDAKELATEVTETTGFSTQIDGHIADLTAQVKHHEDEVTQGLVVQAGQQTKACRTKFDSDKLKLTEFGGDPLTWEAFYDDFRLSVDERDDLTVIEKFKLLKGCLVDEALGVADGYSLTIANYNEVKEALKERFGDPQVAVFAHLMELLELQSIMEVQCRS